MCIDLMMMKIHSNPKFQNTEKILKSHKRKLFKNEKHYEDNYATCQ